MKTKYPLSGVTIREIAEVEDLHPVYVRVLTRTKDFPDPIRKIGANKIFDWRQVNRYFRNREKHKAA